MADSYTDPVGKLPVVPYREPEPWVPSGGFGQFRTPEEQRRDAEVAAGLAEAEEAEAGDEETEEPHAER